MLRNDPPNFFLGGAWNPKKKKTNGSEANNAREELRCTSKSQCFDSTLANDKIALQYI